jgi:hypothetical protein
MESTRHLQALPRGLQAAAMVQVGVRGLARIAEGWGLGVDQQRHLLGGMAKASYYGLLKGSLRTVPAGTLERLSLLLGIWRDLENQVPDPALAAAWLRRPHPDPRFVGLSPLDWMLQGSITALGDVRRYLEAWRFGQ